MCDSDQGLPTLMRAIKVEKDVYAGETVDFSDQKGRRYHIESKVTGHVSWIGEYRDQHGVISHVPWVRPAWKVSLDTIVDLVTGILKRGDEDFPSATLVGLEAILFHTVSSIRRFRKENGVEQLNPRTATRGKSI